MIAVQALELRQNPPIQMAAEEPVLVAR